MAKVVLSSTLVVAAAWLGSVAPGRAESSSHAIDWYTIDAGGRSSTSSAGDGLSGSIAQPDAGTVRGGGYLLAGGFWPGVTCGGDGAADCDGNGLADACESLSERFTEASPEMMIGADYPASHRLTDPPAAAGIVSLTFVAVADLDSEEKYVDVSLNGMQLGSVYVVGAERCAEPPNLDRVLVAPSVYNAAVAAGDVVIDMTAAGPVWAFMCGADATYIQVDVEYEVIGDCNGNRSPDSCDIAEGMSLDLDGNGVPDECEVIADLLLSAPFPGQVVSDNSLQVLGATPGSTVYFLRSDEAGTSSVPGCPGVMLGIAERSVLGSAVADQNGSARLDVAVPPAMTGRMSLFQAAELATCTVSDVVSFTFP